MNFNYKKIAEALILMIGLFLLLNYVSIPLMGIGSTFLEIFGWLISIFGILAFVDYLIKIFKSKNQLNNNNENKN